MARRPKPPSTSSGSPESVAYFRNKGVQPSFDWQDVEPEEHAFAFTVAKATQVDVLTTIQAEVDAAIANGDTKEMFQAKLMPKLVALGWWGKKTEVDPVTGEVKEVQLGSARRLSTIYWGNTRTAWAAGTWERAQRTKKGLPYFLYLLGPSEVHRPAHIILDGTILHVDDRFWVAYFPPNGWGCMCWVRQISGVEAKKLGYDPAKGAPDLGTRTYTNPRTGETRTMPAGIDPGWDSNPGMLRQRNLGRHIAGKLDAAPEELRRVAIKDTISSQQFRRIQALEAKGVAPVGVLPKDRAAQLGSSSRTILFSSATSQKQRKDGKRSLSAEDYLKVQELVDSGKATPDRPNHIVFTKEIDGRLWKAAVKATGDGKELYLSSLHQLRPGQDKTVMKRGE